MNEDTIKLLEECDSGCKMALESMKQIIQYVEDEHLKVLIEDYKAKHDELEQKAEEMLEDNGKEEKKPGAMASAFSWFTTEVKLMIQDDNHQVAKILMDGCNMGIQSISENKNKYSQAKKEVLSLADDLVKIEESFMKDLKDYL